MRIMDDMEDKMSIGITLIKSERERQITQERFDANHDAVWVEKELVKVAIVYLVHYVEYMPFAQFQEWIDIARMHFWPRAWGEKWWKPCPNEVKNLVKAGALIAAEIDRLAYEEAHPMPNDA